MLLCLLAACLSTVTQEEAGTPSLPPSTVPDSDGDLPVSADRWRGFNLQGMYILEGSNHGFREEQLRMIHELGFSYIRLPLDYRTYTDRGDVEYEEYNGYALDRQLLDLLQRY